MLSQTTAVVNRKFLEATAIATSKSAQYQCTKMQGKFYNLQSGLNPTMLAGVRYADFICSTSY